jgi:hypothetical protein
MAEPTTREGGWVTIPWAETRVVRVERQRMKYERMMLEAAKFSVAED